MALLLKSLLVTVYGVPVLNNMFLESVQQPDYTFYSFDFSFFVYTVCFINY